jgi:colicin import membrane protein
MKFKQVPIALVAVLAIGLAGCNKNESATTTAEDANKAAETARVEAAKTAEAAKAEAAKTSEAARAEAAKTSEAARAEAAKTAEAAKAQDVKTADAANAEAAKVAKAADTSRTQGLIDKAKILVAENKFTDASSVLQELSGKSLSAEQTKLVDSLKEQIQKALTAKATDNAASAVGNLLNK